MIGHLTKNEWDELELVIEKSMSLRAGYKTVEEARMYTGGRFRDFSKVVLPAITVWVKNKKRIEHTESMG